MGRWKGERTCSRREVGNQRQRRRQREQGGCCESCRLCCWGDTAATNFWGSPALLPLRPERPPAEPWAVTFIAMCVTKPSALYPVPWLIWLISTWGFHPDHQHKFCDFFFFANLQKFPFNKKINIMTLFPHKGELLGKGGKSVLYFFVSQKVQHFCFRKRLKQRYLNVSAEDCFVFG